MSDMDERFGHATLNGAQVGRPPAPAPLGPYTLVAAIDFGTTYSGYAYSFTNSLEDVKTPLTWATAQFPSSQAPTCLLLSQNITFLAFGYQAREIYWNLTENERKLHYFFENFKMRLHQERQLSTSTELQDVRGRRVRAITVFSLSINHLKEHLISTLKDRGCDCKVEDIKFVLTVPAIWTEPAKQFMRRAATQAGIPSERLVIALEPEVASIYVQQLYPDGPLVQATPVTHVGTKYIVADVGGGTADFSVHVKQRDDTLKELHKANGGACGGTCVDRKFVELLYKIFGKHTVENFQQRFPSHYMRIIDNFIFKKMNFDGSTKLVIHFAERLIKFSTDTIRKRLKFRENIGSLNKEGIDVIDDNIEISASYAKTLFLPTCEFIKHKVEHLLRENSDIQFLILVGGFSNNRYLKQYFQDNLRPGVRLIIPDDSSMAVVKGAVLYGFNPLIVASRVVRFTYGFAVERAFDLDLHPPNRRYTNDNGEEFCRNCFEILIEEGSEVGTSGNSKDLKLVPVWHSAKGALIRIYFTNKRNVAFVDDSGVYPLGECRIRQNTERPFSERQLKANFRFDGTELLVFITNDTGEHVSASFDMID